MCLVKVWPSGMACLVGDMHSVALIVSSQGHVLIVQCCCTGKMASSRHRHNVCRKLRARILSFPAGGKASWRAYHARAARPTALSSRCIVIMEAFQKCFPGSTPQPPVFCSSHSMHHLACEHDDLSAALQVQSCSGTDMEGC